MNAIEALIGPGPACDWILQEGGLSKIDVQDCPVRLSPRRKAALVAAQSLLKEAATSANPPPAVLAAPEDIYKLLLPKAYGLEIEKFWTISMNTRRRVIRVTEVTSGTATQSLAHPREVFRQAIRDGAACIAIAHNHPSGDPEPSSSDLAITRQLREAARILGIELSDHVILGVPDRDPAHRGFYSFRLAGMV